MTGTAPTPAAPYRCRRCGHVLGEYRPDGLRLGGVRVLGGVRLQCPGCGWVRRYSVPSPVDKPPGPDT